MGLIPGRWYLMLIMPSTIGMTLLAVGFVLLVHRARKGDGWTRLRPTMAIAVVGLLLLYAASTPLVATALSRSLERMTPYLRSEDAPMADAIVVLGGGQAGHVSADGTIHLQGGRGADRLEQGIRAFTAGKAPWIVVGGGAFGLGQAEGVGEFMRAEAVRRGVPAERVLACGEAKYTSDEGTAIAALLQPHKVRRILLCTSATHMPRARITYERLGFEVIALPCDFDTRGAAERFSPLLLLPRGQALFQTENGVKEWIGLIAARLGRSP